MTIPTVPIQLMVTTEGRSADLYISGDITRGFQLFGLDFGQETDVSYNDVAQALSDLPEDVDEIYVHINSYGGEVAEGVAIYNALRAAKARVTTVCEGFACSIASVIFMAGSRRVMRPASILMLHNASMGAHGDANDLRKAAQDLETITELSKTAYLEHATDVLTPEKLAQVMDDETWVRPETALEWGLATEIDGPGEDGDEPTQSARTLVADMLTEERGVLEAMDPPVEIYERFDQVFARLDDLEAIMTSGTAKAMNAAQVDANLSTSPKQSSLAPHMERLSHLFEHLSGNEQ